MTTRVVGFVFASSTRKSDSTKFLARVLLFGYVVEMVFFRRVVLLLLFVCFFTASLFGDVWYRLFSADYGIKTMRVIKAPCCVGVRAL